MKTKNKISVSPSLVTTVTCFRCQALHLALLFTSGNGHNFVIIFLPAGAETLQAEGSKGEPLILISI